MKKASIYLSILLTSSLLLFGSMPTMADTGAFAVGVHCADIVYSDLDMCGTPVGDLQAGNRDNSAATAETEQYDAGLLSLMAVNTEFTFADSNPTEVFAKLTPFDLTFVSPEVARLSNRQPLLI